MVMLGIDENSLSKPLAVDANGKIVISPVSPSISYPIPKSGRGSNLALPAGSSYNVVLTIPANQYWRLRVLSTFYVGTVAGVILYPFINNGTNYIFINDHRGIISSSIYATYLDLLLAPSWTMGVLVNGATLNDDVTVDYIAEHIYTL